MDKHIEQIRSEIDEIDSQLLQLIKQRLHFVQKIGDIKSTLGVPVYDAQREIDLIARHRTQAINQNISADLIENILKLLIQESYLNESACHKQVNTESNNVIIIGGLGKMGCLFTKQFQLSGYNTLIIDVEDKIDDARTFSDAGLVLISVPIHKTIEVINKIPPLPQNCVLADLTSTKKDPVRAMIKTHRGPVVGLHPMFGPGVKSLVNQLVIQCNGRMPKKYQWLIEQIKMWGCRVEQISPAAHDKAMAYIQALCYFITFSSGIFLEKEKMDLDSILKLSSPIYRLDLSVIGRLFDQDPELYADILLASDLNLSLIKRYVNVLTEQYHSLRKNGKADFIQKFTNTTSYFGKYAPIFHSETEQVLKHLNFLIKK